MEGFLLLGCVWSQCGLHGDHVMDVISSRGVSIAGWGFIFTCTQVLLKTVHPFTSAKVAMEGIM